MKKGALRIKPASCCGTPAIATSVMDCAGRAQRRRRFRAGKARLSQRKSWRVRKRRGASLTAAVQDALGRMGVPVMVGRAVVVMQDAFVSEGCSQGTVSPPFIGARTVPVRSAPSKQKSQEFPIPSGWRRAANRDGSRSATYANNFFTNSPCTSVSRKSRPWKRYVSFV
jgi:hypothetical protein